VTGVWGEQEREYITRAKALDEWNLDTVSHVPSDKKSAGRTIELRDAASSNNARFFFLYFDSKSDRDQVT